MAHEFTEEDWESPEPMPSVIMLTMIGFQCCFLSAWMLQSWWAWVVAAVEGFAFAGAIVSCRRRPMSRLVTAAISTPCLAVAVAMGWFALRIGA